MATRRVHIAPPPEWEPDPVVLEPADEFESPEAAFGWLACDEWWMGGVSMRWPCRCGRALRVLCKIGDVSLAGPYSLELVACACTPHDVDLIVLRDKG